MMESTYFPSVPSLPASLPLLHVAEADLELLILQTPLPKHWDHRCAPPLQTNFELSLFFFRGGAY